MPIFQTLCLCQGCENLCLFFRVKGCLSAKKFGRNSIKGYDIKMTCSLWYTELYFIYGKRGGILLQIFSCIWQHSLKCQSCCRTWSITINSGKRRRKVEFTEYKMWSWCSRQWRHVKRLTNRCQFLCWCICVWM